MVASIFYFRMSHTFKNFLYVFTAKNKVQPVYTYEQQQSGGYYCELRVEGYDFVGFGEAKSKKDAQGAAAVSFCQFLVEGGHVTADSLPASLDSATATDSVSSSSLILVSRHGNLTKHLEGGVRDLIKKLSVLRNGTVSPLVAVTLLHSYLRLGIP